MSNNNIEHKESVSKKLDTKEEKKDEIKVLCECCEKVFLRKELFEVGDEGSGKYVCVECKDDCYDSCDDCGNLYLVDDLKTVSNEEHVCELCLEEDYTECDSCSEYYQNDEITSSEDGTEYCDDCYNELYTTCEICDAEISREDAEEFEDDDDYITICNECRPQAESNYIIDVTQDIPNKCKNSFRNGVKLRSRIQNYLNENNSEFVREIKDHLNTYYIVLRLNKHNQWVIKPTGFDFVYTNILNHLEPDIPSWYLRIYTENFFFLFGKIEKYFRKLYNMEYIIGLRDKLIHELELKRENDTSLYI